jgi:uncharacterized membrane protein YuzA (DUF378 family)
MNKIIFREEQQFREWWRTIIVLISIVPAIITLVYSLLRLNGMNDVFGRASMNMFTVVVSIILLLASLWLYFSYKLEVWINEDGINYRFFPLIYKNKLVSKEEIQRYEIRKYSPIFDYGGRGIRYGFGRKWGKAYSISGNLGLQLYLTNGKKVLFGTQRSQAITYAMDEMMKQK